MIVLATGKRALFTRPELKVERHSYDIPTPSAMIGMLSSVYWKPEMRYIIDKIHVLNEIKFETVMTNAQSSGISTSGNATYRSKLSTPRSARILRDVAYAVEFHIELTGKGTSPNDCIKKHEAILSQRLRKGQYFSPPYLGCREFVCDVVELFRKTDIPHSYYAGTNYSFGKMLHHIDFAEDKAKQVWFTAKMIDGVVDCTRGVNTSDNGGWLFKKLVDFYDNNVETLNFPQYGYSLEKLTFNLTIDKEGNPISFKPIRITEKGKIAPSMEIVPEQVLGRSSNILPNFAWDNEKYVLGVDKTESSGEKKVAAFEAKLNEVLDGYENESIKAVKLFYKNKKHKDALLFLGDYLKDNKLGGNIAFTVDGEEGFFHNNPLVTEAWENYYSSHQDGDKITCMVTEKEDTLANLHPLIKGVAGASSFAKLVSLEESSHAFENYGWTRMENTPMGKLTVFKYATALNYMLSNLDHRVTVNGSTYVFWSETNNLHLLGYLNSILTGYMKEGVDKNAIPEGEEFYILQLKGNASRIYIKEYRELTWGDKNSFKFLVSLVKRSGNVNYRNSIWEDVEQLNEKEIFTMGESSSTKKSQGYLLGELFAICEKAQMDAVESTQKSKTIADKLMSSASVKPASIFPRILNLAQHHLNKVDYGMKHRMQEKISELADLDIPFPDKLSSAGQCDFYVGYNMQCKAFAEEKALRIKEKAAKNDKVPVVDAE